MVWEYIKYMTVNYSANVAFYCGVKPAYMTSHDHVLFHWRQRGTFQMKCFSPPSRTNYVFQNFLSRCLVFCLVKICRCVFKKSKIFFIWIGQCDWKLWDERKGIGSRDRTMSKDSNSCCRKCCCSTCRCAQSTGPLGTKKKSKLFYRLTVRK